MPEAEEPRGYPLAQEHAAMADAWLGLETERVEAEVSQRASREARERGGDQNSWIGLPVRTLLTPYVEIRSLLARLKLGPGAHLVDLGAGYGRMGFVVHRHSPGTRFTGYERVPERVREGARALERFGCGSRIRLIEADLSEPGFRPEPADCYFLYDFGSRAAIEKCLHDLRAIARARPLTVVGRGRASRDAIERGHPWLSQVVPPEHSAHSSIYRSAD